MDSMKGKTNTQSPTEEGPVSVCFGLKDIGGKPKHTFRLKHYKEEGGELPEASIPYPFSLAEC